MQIISDRFILSMLGTDFIDFIYLPSVGAAGGILVAWRRHLGFTGLFFLEYAGELHIIIFKKKKKVGAEALTNHNTEV